MCLTNKVHQYLLMLFSLISFLASGQNEIHFSHLGMQDGFSNSRANVVIQDRNGYIWVGTWNGLNRYDGYSCMSYQPGYHDSSSVANREITELLEDSQGHIWIGTSFGLSRLDPQTGQFRTYEFHNRILSLFEAKDGFIWIGTWGGGLYLLDPKDGTSTHFFNNDIVSDVFVDSRNIVWVATYYGLLKRNPGDSEFQRFTPINGKNSISHSVVTQITESADGSIWAGTWGGGLDRVELDKEGKQLHFTNLKLNQTETGKGAGVVSRLYYDQFRNLWIGTWNDGLRLMPEKEQTKSPTNAKLITYYKENDNPTSLSDDGVSALLVDRAGVLWVGAASLDRAAITESGINRYKLRSTDKSTPAVRSFAEFRDQVWVGAGRSIYQYERKSNQLEFRKEYQAIAYRTGQSTVNANSVFDLKADAGGLWAGTEDAGLIYYPFSDDQLLKPEKAVYFNQNSTVKLPGDKVCCLALNPNKSGVIWVGTLQSGFIKLSRKADDSYESTVYQATADGLSDNNIRALFEDSKGRLWIGTQDGLNCFDPNNQSFQRFYYSATDHLSLNDNIINTIFEDRSGNLWIGTNSGLNKLLISANNNGKTTFQFKGYPDIEYLGNEIVSNLMDDDEGNLWIRMYRGFVKFNIQHEEVVGKYFSRDYENIRFERNSTLKLGNKQVILDAQGGFLTITPNNSNSNSVPPKVVITDLQVLNRSLQTDQALRLRLGLNQTIPYTSQLRLSYKDKMITLVFSAMDYKNPSKNDYYYKLEGFDNQWIHSASHNSATYTNLPHGDYVFKVKAKNSDGVWSTDETTLLLQITPPFWKTIWAYLFYCLLFGCLIYFFNQYSIIRAQEKSAMKFEKLKTEEMQRLNEMKSFFFTDITHELKTPLSLIIGPANELTADKNLSPASLRHAELIKNSAMKLLRLVNQLLEFRKMEKGIPEQLLIQSVDVHALLNDISGLFSAMAESRKIKFQLLLPHDPILARLDPDKLEKIIFNLISNAFKYTRDQGWIRVEAYMKPESDEQQFIVIQVTDNGIGISEEHKNRIFERFYQVNQIRTQSTGGIGLYMAKALVEQHQGTITVDSEPGRGSCFTVQLPFVPPSELADDETSIAPIPANEQADDVETEALDAENELSLTHRLTILVLEDDRELNDFLVNGLSSEFKVLSAFNGQKGMEITRKEMPDLILSDIMMPEMNGFEFCKQLRKDLTCSHIPVVFLTAKTMQEDELKGLRLGAVDYIYKPFNLDSLKLKLHNILATRRQIQEKLRTELILEPDNIELSSLDEIFLKQAVEAVQNKLDDPTFDVDAFSKELGASPNQVYRKIKALTGQTAKEFIRNQRLKIAAGLLVQRKRNISEIIYMVGFSNPSYFARCFKEFYGCTPKEYIDKNAEADLGSNPE